MLSEKAKQSRKESLYESEQVILELADALDASRKTLRDEFAMAAITGLLGSEDFDRELDAKMAYLFADTLLATREREVSRG
jgi:hypothetical protein